MLKSQVLQLFFSCIDYIDIDRKEHDPGHGQFVQRQGVQVPPPFAQALHVFWTKVRRWGPWSPQFAQALHFFGPTSGDGVHGPPNLPRRYTFFGPTSWILRGPFGPRVPNFHFEGTSRSELEYFEVGVFLGFL